MIKPITTYQWLLWDWNGTLLNDLHISFDITRKAFAKRGAVHIEQEQYRKTLRHPIRDFYRDYGLDLDNDGFDLLAAEFHDEYEARLEEVGLHEGVFDAISYLQEREVQQGILSALPYKILKESVQRFGVSHLMTSVTSPTSNHAHGKIDEAREWIKSHQAAPSKVVIIGDSLHDAEVADAVGFDCVLVSHGYQHEEVLKKTSYPVVGSIVELLEGWRGF